MHGSLLIRSQVLEARFCDFENITVRIDRGQYRLVETVDSFVRPNDELTFKYTYEAIRL